MRFGAGESAGSLPSGGFCPGVRAWQAVLIPACPAGAQCGVDRGVDPGHCGCVVRRLSLGSLGFLWLGFCLWFCDGWEFGDPWEFAQHGLGGDVAGPFVLVGGARGCFALAALLLLAEQTGVGGQGGADHRGVLGVYSDDQVYVASVEADQAEQVLGLCSGGDALGGQFGLVGIDGGQGGDSGDGGMISGQDGFGRVLDRRRQQRYQRVHQVAAGLRREV